MITHTPTVCITLPVYNEESCLQDSVDTLHTFCTQHLGSYTWSIIIADNHSSDHTPEIGRELAQKIPNVDYQRIEEKGRGRAIMKIWTDNTADIQVYMDIDLSTDLSHLPELLDTIRLEGFDIAVGSRNLPRSQVIGRSLKRTFISKGYIWLIKMFMQVNLSDAQCGFKAIRKSTAKLLLPLMDATNWKGSAWFFDTELLVLARKAGLSVAEIPVRWTDDQSSTVHVLDDALEDIRGLIRLQKTKPWNRLPTHHET